ncbi:proline dehydrogenase 1, mitochondrial-like [Gigantopelta aegis]|uniref:proline dehydrogenase 1, mitochondrial-like n=1 Tax=Gigantopelta aegis TaxID=1735272 RepID=UPI001B888830|nr:proline dehydrogenase 1, mitochondrial-like [Gigantopelta aegis]
MSPTNKLQMSEVLVSLRNFFEVFAGADDNIFLRRFREKEFRKKLKNLGVPISRDESKKWFSLLDISQDGEVDLLDWDNLLEVNMSLCKLFTVPNIKTGELEPLVVTLTQNEEDQMKNMLRRVNKVVKYAAEKEVRVMIDAEQTYFQPAISRFTMEMMRKFNKDGAVVFNTYQCYLKQAYNNMIVDMDLAKRENFYFGAKLVRGAYMEQERDRAVTLGYEDPINPSYDETTKMYNRVLEEVMTQINCRDRGKIAVMVASHNEDTVRYTVEMMKQHGIRPEDRLICFGQLLGMCDQISFPLGQAGYSVYKYVPFGPVEKVLPYLSRRAMENRGVLKKVKKEKYLLWEELKRRVKAGQLFYDPQEHVPPHAGVKMSS